MNGGESYSDTNTSSSSNTSNESSASELSDDDSDSDNDEAEKWLLRNSTQLTLSSIGDELRRRRWFQLREPRFTSSENSCSDLDRLDVEQRLTERWKSGKSFFRPRSSGWTTEKRQVSKKKRNVSNSTPTDYFYF